MHRDDGHQIDGHNQRHNSTSKPSESVSFCWTFLYSLKLVYFIPIKLLYFQDELLYSPIFFGEKFLYSYIFLVLFCLTPCCWEIDDKLTQQKFIHFTQENAFEYVKSVNWRPIWPGLIVLTLYVPNCSEETNMHLHFMSFLHTDMPKIIEILPRLRAGLTYFT